MFAAPGWGTPRSEASSDASHTRCDSLAWQDDIAEIRSLQAQAARGGKDASAKNALAARLLSTAAYRQVPPTPLHPEHSER